jgi:signal transduction histidine kinase
MISLETFLRFIERGNDLLLVVDEDGLIVHANDSLCRLGGQGATPHVGLSLEQILTPDSLADFRRAMERVNGFDRSVAVYRPLPPRLCSVAMQAIRITDRAEDGSSRTLHVFYGNQRDGLATIESWQREERVKELSCLYATAEWIDASRSVGEFFERLPEYLVRGMRCPEETVVWASYQGQEYGQRPPGRTIGARLSVFGQDGGEILVGYVNQDLELLAEEQKMLTEIVRTLDLALERKELKQRVLAGRSEQEEAQARVEALQAEIALRGAELEAQREALDAINANLDRVNRSWTESHSRLESIFQGIPEDCALIDRHRNVIKTNRKETAPSGKCHQVFFGSDTPCRDCRLARIVREKTPIAVHVVHEGRHLEVHAIPLFDERHEVDGIMEFYRDVTLEKTYEQQLRQADKLASLGQLVSGIGHEINNPNQFIRGNVKILKQAMEDVLPILDERHASEPGLRIARLPYPFFRQHIMTLVDDMAHGSERIKGIVEGLKRFARRDEGLLIDTVDTNTIVAATARLVQNEVSKHADIQLDLAPELPTFVGNAQKIEQVLVNLVVNAAQAMPEERRGTIVVRTHREDPCIVIEVRDDGRGMNESTIKQIFDPFFTTKRAKGGTGLGLAIVYRIIEEHGGRVEVQSTPGLGTTFTIRLPIRPSLPSSTPRQGLPA